MRIWIQLGKALWKVGKYVSAAFAGFEAHNLFVPPPETRILAIPEPNYPKGMIPQPTKSIENDQLNASDLMILGWAALAILFAIFVVVTVFKCISAFRFTPEK